jgi:hypothetical protein
VKPRYTGGVIGITRALALLLALLLCGQAAYAGEPQAKPHKRKEIKITGHDLASILWLPFAPFAGMGMKPPAEPAKKPTTAKAKAPKGTKFAKR